MSIEYTRITMENLRKANIILYLVIIAALILPIVVFLSQYFVIYIVSMLIAYTIVRYFNWLFNLNEVDEKHWTLESFEDYMDNYIDLGLWIGTISSVGLSVIPFKYNIVNEIADATIKFICNYYTFIYNIF